MVVLKGRLSVSKEMELVVAGAQQGSMTPLCLLLKHSLLWQDVSVRPF